MYSVSVATRCHGGGADDVTSGPSTEDGDAGAAAGRDGVEAGAGVDGRIGVVGPAPAGVDAGFAVAAGFGVIAAGFGVTAGFGVDAGDADAVGAEAAGAVGVAGAGSAGSGDFAAGVPFGLFVAFVPFARSGLAAGSDLPTGDAVATVRSSRVVSAGKSAVSGLSGEVTSSP
jgi:hypothetical protein